MLSDGLKSYAFDGQNRLTMVKDKTKTISFAYDDKGRRTSASVNGKRTIFHYEGDRVAFETDATGATTKKYSYDDEGRPVSFVYNGETYYYTLDGHGDVTGLTDASGAQVVSYSYDAYGSIASMTSWDVPALTKLTQPLISNNFNNCRYVPAS